jgi:acyl-CoA thioesterase
LASARQRDKNISAMTMSVSQEQRPIKRATRLRRLMCHDPNSAETSHLASLLIERES